MKIVLKNDWDISIRPPIIKREEQGHFVGREQELSLLVNEILRRKSGSILISGYRGVGKTSLVYKALQEVNKRVKDVIIVLLNAAQLEAESEKKEINPIKIIENLIRRLYSTTHDPKTLPSNIRTQIEVLYRKAVASEFKDIEIQQYQEELSKEIQREEVIDFLLTEKNLRIAIFLISWTIAAALQYGNITPWEWFNKLVPLLLAFPIPFTFNLLYKKHSKTRRFEGTKKKAEKLYQFDNSIGNLEFDLEKIHTEISQQGKKLIYIIDELDKLETSQVEEVLKFFKNLFTLSDALFIFVGGEELFAIGSSLEHKDVYRPKEYTYFTSRYFLARPLWPDLSKFFDQIFEEKEVSEKELEIHKRAICFDAKNDFFDLNTCMKDRITGFDENNRPIIKSEDLGNDIEKARLHKAMTILFEEKYMSSSHSEWKENEVLLRKLYEHVHEIYSGFSGTQFADPDNDTIDAEMLRDFNGLLYRLGVLNIQNESQKNIRGLQVLIRTYQHTGSIPQEPPSHLTDPTEFESRFVTELERYCQIIISIVNAFRIIKAQTEINEQNFWDSPEQFVKQINSWGFNATNQFNTHYPVYQNIKLETPPYPYKREDIEQRSEQIENHIKAMLNGLPTIASRMIPALLPQLNLQILSLQQNANLFGGSANEIRKALNAYNPLVVSTQDYSRQILLIYNKIDVIKIVKKQIRDNAQTHIVASVVEEAEKFKTKGFYSIFVAPKEKLKISMARLLKESINFFGA